MSICNPKLTTTATVTKIRSKQRQYKQCASAKKTLEKQTSRSSDDFARELAVNKNLAQLNITLSAQIEALQVDKDKQLHVSAEDSDALCAAIEYLQARVDQLERMEEECTRKIEQQAAERNRMVRANIDQLRDKDQVITRLEQERDEMIEQERAEYQRLKLDKQEALARTERDCDSRLASKDEEIARLRRENDTIRKENDDLPDQIDLSALRTMAVIQELQWHVDLCLSTSQRLRDKQRSRPGRSTATTTSRRPIEPEETSATEEAAADHQEQLDDKE